MIAACGLGNDPDEAGTTMNLPGAELWIPMSAGGPRISFTISDDDLNPPPGVGQHVGNWYDIALLDPDRGPSMTLTIDGSAITGADLSDAFIAYWDTETSEWVVGETVTKGDSFEAPVAFSGVYGLFAKP
jgi:hypothetical protein